MNFNLVFLSVVNIISLSHISWADEVLGCGGYIKSEVEIDYSQIHVKLLTEQRNVRYETECAPHNGYYFIPIYNHGHYILKVVAPDGWSFEPDEMLLKIDGQTDPCLKGEVINFIFKGFAILGRVVTSGSDLGPAGVTVIVNKKGQEISRTVSGTNGDFIFSPVAAGSYEIEASHSSWTFVNSKVSVHVVDKNGDVGTSLVVAGYSLSGKLSSTETSNLCKNIKFVLHSTKDIKQKIDCKKDQLVGYETQSKYPIVCHVSPTQNCVFTFSTIPLGKYMLVPWGAYEDNKLDIVPSSIHLEILHNDFGIKEPFKVIGRDFKGQVLPAKDSTKAALAGVVISIGDKFKTESDAKGLFAVPKLKFGSYKIKLVSDGYEFEDFTVSLQPTSASLILYPSRYRVCFTVSVDSASGINIPWTVRVVGANQQHNIQTDSFGSACTYLPPGEFVASVLLSPQEEEIGIRFGPVEHKFVVDFKPLGNLSFAQYLAEIHGTISCIENCRSLTVNLKPPKGGGVGTAKSTTSVQAKFAFKDVVPGEYLLSIDKEEWCWKNQTVNVSVNKKNVTAKFVQTGFRLSLNSSHRTTLSYITNHGHKGKLDVAEGTSRECVSDAGQYIFTPSDCHRYDSSILGWDTTSPQFLSLIATHHKISGSIVSNEPGPFFLTVKSSRRPDEVIGPMNLSETEKRTYVFNAWLESGETATLLPSSSSNLFQYHPKDFSIENIVDCLPSAVKFMAERALFFKGNVKPPIKGVTIKVMTEGTELDYMTNSDGVFVAGPLNKSMNYVVSAEKLGYLITPEFHQVNISSQTSSETVKMSFDAHKLAEIVIIANDEDGKPLEGVLVSTSGGDSYRQNSLTEADGSLVFRALMPSEYFIKPMMKEYVFEPSSKMVKVESGATVPVNVKGNRIAYSVLGQTVSLNGEIEADVSLEIVGSGPKCEGLQEEATSDRQGNFRIRGLIPNCDYRLRLKEGAGFNEHVERSLPAERRVRVEKEDLRGLRVVVIRPSLQMDVSMLVSTDPQFLPTLSMELYRDDSPDMPLHVVPFGAHSFAMLPPMIIDHKTYTIRIASSLPARSYTYVTPSSTFVANSSFIYRRLSFDASLRVIDAETSRGTVMFLLFLACVALAILNAAKIRPILVYLYEEGRVLASGKTSSKHSPSREPVDSHGMKKKVKSRKI